MTAVFTMCLAEKHGTRDGYACIGISWSCSVPLSMVCVVHMILLHRALRAVPWALASTLGGHMPLLRIRVVGSDAVRRTVIVALEQRQTATRWVTLYYFRGVGIGAEELENLWIGCILAEL